MFPPAYLAELPQLFPLHVKISINALIKLSTVDNDRYATRSSFRTSLLTDRDFSIVSNNPSPREEAIMKLNLQMIPFRKVCSPR